jgi:hypothetical protein
VRIHRRDPGAKIGPRLVTLKPGGDKQLSIAPRDESAPASLGGSDMQRQAASSVKGEQTDSAEALPSTDAQTDGQATKNAPR